MASRLTASGAYVKAAGDKAPHLVRLLVSSGSHLSQERRRELVKPLHQDQGAPASDLPFEELVMRGSEERGTLF